MHATHPPKGSFGYFPRLLFFCFPCFFSLIITFIAASPPFCLRYDAVDSAWSQTLWRRTQSTIWSGHQVLCITWSAHQQSWYRPDSADGSVQAAGWSDQGWSPGNFASWRTPLTPKTKQQQQQQQARKVRKTQGRLVRGFAHRFQWQLLRVLGKLLADIWSRGPPFLSFIST